MANQLFLNADDSIAQTVVDLGTGFEPTVLSGDAFTFATSAVVLDTEDSDPTDDLTTIANGGTLKMILLRCASADRVVTVKHAVSAPDNILTLDGTDIVLDDPNKLLWLIYNGSYWICMAFGGGNAPDVAVDWCFEWDLTAEQGDWDAPASTYQILSYVGGVGFTGSSSGFGEARLTLALPIVQYATSFEADLIIVNDAAAGAFDFTGTRAQMGGSLVSSFGYSGQPGSTPSSGTYNIVNAATPTTNVFDEYRMWMRTFTSRTITIPRIRFGFHGVPFLTDNC